MLSHHFSVLTKQFKGGRNTRLMRLEYKDPIRYKHSVHPYIVGMWKYLKGSLEERKITQESVKLNTRN